MRDRPSWLPGALVIGALLLLTAGSAAAIAASLMSTEPSRDAAVSPPGLAEPTPTATGDAQSVDGSPRPADGVAGSRRLAADFDMLPTGSQVDGWTVSTGGRLETAAQPTAVDRSARLTGEAPATACQDLDVQLAALEATFMIDRPIQEDVTLLALALDGGPTHRLALTDGRASLVVGGQAVELEPGVWYRWVLASGNGEDQLRLLAADGTLLAEGTAPARADVRATEFCMTAPAPARLYLSDLIVETR